MRALQGWTLPLLELHEAQPVTNPLVEIAQDAGFRQQHHGPQPFSRAGIEYCPRSVVERDGQHSDTFTKKLLNNVPC